MKKGLLLFFCLIVVSSFRNEEKNDVASSSNSENILPGNWILTEIETSDSIQIVPRSEAMQKLQVSSVETATLQYKIIPLKSYLERQLEINSTKFIFRDDKTFDFFRKEELTFSGKWKIKNKELILEYISGKSNTKINKILKLNNDELVIESESHNKPVIFHFTRQ